MKELMELLKIKVKNEEKFLKQLEEILEYLKVVEAMEGEVEDYSIALSKKQYRKEGEVKYNYDDPTIVFPKKEKDLLEVPRLL